MDFGIFNLNGYVGGADDGALPSLSVAGSRAARIRSPCDGSEPSLEEWKASNSGHLIHSLQLEAPTTRQRPRSTTAASSPLMLSFSSTTNPSQPQYGGGVSWYQSIGGMDFPFRQQGGGNDQVVEAFTGYRGTFTPSQWMELELQALIYKYIVANVPVPSHLLIHIRNSVNPSAYAGAYSGFYSPNSIGWGIFHQGLSGSSDPETGRCRRTDGKKWRCANGVVPDQKYCDRHAKKARHRSRKHVEGQNGQAVAVSTITNVVPIVSSPSASVMSSIGTSKSLGASQNQFKGLQPTTSNSSANDVGNRMQGAQGKSMISPIKEVKSKDNPFFIPKQHVPMAGSSSELEFGLVSSASLLSPTEKSSYISTANCSSSFLSFNDQETHHQRPLHKFMDDWPKNHDGSTFGWPEELKSDWTLLSMSTPMTCFDFSSCSNSPCQEKFTLAPPMSIGTPNNPTLTWGNSMGGPLGEALSNICSSGEVSKSSSPTGVLQKSTFVSLSNSSSGSSPRADKKPVS